MVNVKGRVIHFFMVISIVLLSDLFCFGIAGSANNRSIIIDENLKPGMTLKDAVELLGPPERVTISNKGTIIIPYSALGLSIEIKNDGTLVEGIHVGSSFKGSFASGVEIGADSQKILSAYNQPDVMTKDIIEYTESARVFQIHQGRLTGADLYLVTGKLNKQASNKKIERNKEAHEELKNELRKELREEVREEVRQEVREEVRQEVSEEVDKTISEDFDVFDLFGFKVKNTPDGVVITEVRPGSVAETGGLKVGEPVRKAFYKGAGTLNIYAKTGLDKLLKRAVLKRKKTVNILLSEHYYYKVEVPRRF